MSVLSPQTVEVRLSKLDTKTSDRLTIAGTLEVAQNVTMTETGLYDRRSGTSLLTTVAGARNIHDHGDELIIGTDDTLYSRYGGADNSRGSLTSFDTSVSQVNNTAFAQTQHDMVRAGGLDYHVWVDARGGLRYAVRDVATGAYVVSEIVVTTDPDDRIPRLFVVGTDILLTYVTSDTGVLSGRKIAQASPGTVGSANTIDLDYREVSDNSPGGYDGIVVSASEVTLAYLVANGGAPNDERARVRRWNVSTMSSAAVLTESADTGNREGSFAILNYDSLGGYHIAQSAKTTGVVRLLVASAGLGSFTTSATVKTYSGTPNFRGVTGWLDGSGTSHILVTHTATVGTSNNRLATNYLTRTSGGVSTDVATYYGLELASHVFTSDSVKYVLVSAGFSGQLTGEPDRASLFIMSATTGTLVGRALPSVARVDVQPALPAVQTTSTGFVCATNNLITSTQYGACAVYFDPSVRSRWLEAAGVTVIPGSWPRIYDGLGVSELGFEGPPHFIESALVGSSGLSDGTYYYRFVWEWIDGTGRRHQSEPSAAVEAVVTGGPKEVYLTVESLTATLKKAPNQGALLVAYRTEVDPPVAAEAEFFRATTVANDTSSVAVVAVDTTSDAVLVTQERLYTIGDAVLANTASSPCTAVELWGNRLWSTDGEFVVFSKLIEEATGVSHSDTQFIQVTDKYGDFVALADGGSRLLAFKSGAIYAITGQGPDNTGAGEFPQPDRLELPLGARSQVSVVSTEIGVFFQDSATGQIWILGDAGAEYIGAPVEDVVAGLTVVDAVQVGRQVRFYTTAGTTLVYDLHHKLWTWFTGQAAVGAGVVDGVAHYLTSGGAVRYDDPSVWTEAGSTYQAVLETGWLSFAGLSGHQRTYRIVALGQVNGAHTISLTPSYKFGTGTETKSLASTAIVAAHGYRVEARPTLNFQRSTSIKVRLSDDSPSTAGWGLEALILEVGVDRKSARLPSAHRAT